MIKLTRYFVLVLLTGWLSQSCTFNKQEPLVFVQLCDPQLGMGGYQHDMATFNQAVVQINALNPAFVLICGDLVHHAADSSFNDFLSVKNKLTVPCYLAAGNHDVGKTPSDSTLKSYREIIGKDYFSFEAGNYSFFVTNSQLWTNNLGKESELHDEWFKDELTTSTSNGRSVIVAGHYPLFTDSIDEADHYFNLPLPKRHEVINLLKEHNTLAYLSGHTHRPIENSHDGILLVSGQATSRNLDNSPLGFLLWTVINDSIAYRFIPLDNLD